MISKILSNFIISPIKSFNWSTFWVKNVGQGNLNVLEIHSINIFYDLGYSINASKAEIDTFYNNNIKLFQNKFIIIISHWDLDHYQLLLKLVDSKEIQNLTTLIVSSVMPNRTVINLMNTLESKNVEIIKVPCAPKTKAPRGLNFYTKYNASKTFFDQNIANLKIPLYDKFSIEIFRGAKRANRNRYSLVVIMNFYKYKIILTGDSNYKDVDYFIFNKLDSSEDDIIYYVVPHHGGNAGNVTFENLLFDKTKSDFIISVGENNYGHPLKKNIYELNWHTENLYQTNILKTDFKRTLFVDFEIPLTKLIE